jgi:4'-phosphopantetheinyl transferase
MATVGLSSAGNGDAGVSYGVHYSIQDWKQVPAELDWLTSAERARLDGFRFEKRRRDWLSGRWAAKLALLEIAGMSQDEIARFEIASAADGAPLPKLDGGNYGAQLSVSHSNGRAFCAVTSEAALLGCDIELVESRSAGFVETFFTNAESERIERADPGIRDELVTMIWSAKESTLKALRTGLRADTRCVEVIDAGEASADGWNTVRTMTSEAREFSGLWRRDDGFVQSIVACANPA